MSTIRAREPGWADVLEDHAAEWMTARRLVGQLGACEAAALAFCRLLERWARGDALSVDGRRTRRSSATCRRSRRDRARRARPSARPLSARARIRPRRRPLLVRRTGCRRAARVGACLEARRRRRECDARRAGVPRARRPRARAAGSRGHGAHRRRCPTARRSGPACSISARTSSARQPTCAHLPPNGRRQPPQPVSRVDQPRPRRRSGSSGCPGPGRR